jgi:hypothetical protein
MKYIYLSLILFLSFSSILTSQNSSKTVQLISSDNQEIVLRFDPGKYEFSPANNETAGYILHTLEGTPLLIKGYPDVEKLTTSVIIPDNAEMQYEITEVNFTEIENIEILPSKGSLSRSIDPASVSYEYNEMYHRDEFWPKNIVELKEPYILRDYRGMAISCCPFQYNPVTKKLRIYSSITIKLTSSGVSTVNVFNQNNRSSKLVNDFENIYRNQFLNYPSTKYSPLIEDGNMLIISYGPFIAAMQPFVMWKKQKGIATEIVDVSNFSSSTEIKNYVAEYYATNGLNYLLLVGDAEQVPTCMNPIGPTDNAYGYILGDDHYSEILVGRFSAESVADVETQVLRTVEYEMNTEISGSWYTSAIGLATEQGPGDDNEYDFEHIRNIRTKLLNYTYTEMSENYDGDHGGLDIEGDPNGQMILDQLNLGAGAVIYTGHGWDQGWGTSGFSNTEIESLVNINKLPFIWSVACSNGAFVNGTCFGEGWLRATDSGKPTGAIAVLMSTISQYWSEPMDGQDEMVDLLTESITGNVKHSFGGISMSGCLKMIDDYGQGGADMADTWMCFGDPSVVLRTKTPETMTINHDPSIVIGSSSTTINCDVEAALISLTLGGEIIGTGYVNEGLAMITFSPLSVIDTILVTATAYNKAPCFGQILIVAPDAGPYIIYQFSSVDDAAENNNQLADYDENIFLNISLKNIGPENAEAVQATLSTSDTYIEIANSSHEWGQIIGNTESLQNLAYQILISDGIPDQHTINFTLNITDVNDGLWISYFQLTVNAPNPKIGLCLLDDSEGGNGNGIFEPGETADLFIQSTNTGHCSMVSALSTISCNSAAITVNSESFPLANVNPGDTVLAIFNITADNASDQCAQFDIINDLGYGTYLAEKIFSRNIRPAEEDFESGSLSEYTWDFVTDTIWHVDESISYEGNWCAKSDWINHSQATSMFIIGNVASDDSISFYYKVSSELNWDWLTFYIDDGYRGSWSGEAGWARASFPVTQGTHTFRWTYSKDYVDYDPIGSDCAWIDYILFPCDSDMPVLVQETNIKSETDFTVFPNPANTDITLVCTFEKTGTDIIKIYSVTGQLMSERKYYHGDGQQMINQDVSSLKSGLYYILLLSEDGVNKAAFVIE